MAKEGGYTLEASWAKLYTSEMVQRVANKAMQINCEYFLWYIRSFT